MKRLFFLKDDSPKHAVLAVLFLFLCMGMSQAVMGQATAYAVSSANVLVRFNTSTPGTVSTIGPVTNLQAGENILGIDFRPATGELYALGSTSRLYTINKTTAAATSVGVLSTSLSGASFGFDFNPTVDRIRIVSNTGQNLRVNPTNGAVTVDGAINGATINVTAAGYSNSFSGATSTTLFDISAATDTLYIQNPPNNGTLAAVGSLGVDVTDVNGFDILSSNGTAFAALTTSSVPLTSLFTINLTSGAATSVGTIGNGLTTYSGFAVEIGSTTNFTVFGVTTANNLIRFNSARSNTILASVAITGLQAGENVLGIDFRPATGQLFALGSTSRLYTINTVTAAATQVGTAGAFTLSGTDFGFDFNPVVDRIRIVSNTGQNLRVNPNDGTLTATDGSLLGQVVAAAYTNNFAGTTSTTLYDIDSGSDSLLIQNPPNNGTLILVGSLGINVTNEAGFDISAGSNNALAALQLNGATSSGLYRIDLTTGAASIIGPIGGSGVIRDIAIGRSTASGSSTATLDFNGDGRTDYAIFRNTNDTWYISPLPNGSFFGGQFGLSSSDILTPGDYDGDGKTDFAVWRISEGMFYVLRSSDQGITYFQWGITGDEPLSRDYDGDGKTDFAVVRRQSNALVWYIVNSSNNSIRIEQFGLADDVAAPGDYDGDGRFDLAVYRGQPGQSATFFVQGSTAGFFTAQWGLGGDIVVPGDYDGDGKTDFAVVRAGTPYVWYVLRSSDRSFTATGFGTKPDFMTQGDYDGDGKTDIAVWAPITGTFNVMRSSTQATTQYQFGLNGDYPVANIFTQ